MSTPEARFGALTALQAAAAPDEKQALAAAPPHSKASTR